MLTGHDTQVMLKPNHQGPVDETIDQYLGSVSTSLNTELLNKTRSYLTTVQHLNYQLNEDIQKTVQEDFVQERRQQHANGQGGNRVGMSTDDLHAHLVLARLVGLSRGHTSLTQDVWEETKRLERARKERVEHLPPQRNGPQLGPAGIHV